MRTTLYFRGSQLFNLPTPLKAEASVHASLCMSSSGTWNLFASTPVITALVMTMAFGPRFVSGAAFPLFETNHFGPKLATAFIFHLPTPFKAEASVLFRTSILACVLVHLILEFVRFHMDDF